MHGTNEVRGQDLTASLLQVKEVFLTIQGEGPHTGRPAVFVRMAGCNLQCTFCDTEFDGDLELPDILDEDLVDTILTKGGSANLVVFTGGEPLLQPIDRVIGMLIDDGKHVQIETAGTVWISELERYKRDDLTVVVSPKTTTVHSVFKRKEISNVVAWKYIVNADQVDEYGHVMKPPQGGGPYKGEYPVAAPPMWMPSERILFQPCDVDDKEQYQRNVDAAVKLAMEWNGRVSLQVHKILGVR